MAARDRVWHDGLLCRGCSQPIPREEFYWSSSRCLACRREYGRVYREQHVDRIKETDHMYYALNRDKYLEKNKTYAKAHPDRMRATQARYRARKKAGADLSTATLRAALPDAFTAAGDLIADRPDVIGG